MINLKAALKTALVVGVIALVLELISTFPLFFAKTAIILGGAWGASVLYRWFDDTDESKTK
jgi:hypothetical protein